jgi:SAM-dependent methyltransferase
VIPAERTFIDMGVNDLMNVVSKRVFVCPFCRTVLQEHDTNLRCLTCKRVFPVSDGIPDFLTEDMSPERRKMITVVDRLSAIYETPLWYPIVYHFYGGLFIPSVKREIRMVTEMLEIVGGVALDVACGTGPFSRSIAQEAKQVYGVDISMGMLRAAREYAGRAGLKNMVFARADGEHLPFPDGFFEGVTCCGALHLFPDTRQVLGEMHRVLKKGRKLVVMTFVRRRLLGIQRVYEHLAKDHHVHVFDVHELQSYLKNTGFGEFTYHIYGAMILFEARKV